MIKYFIGPMSKNVVDCVISSNSLNSNKIGFIPSRRQVSYDGGYVNNWCTESFRDYAKDSFIVRDHAGPGQGVKNDDGYLSLSYDCKFFDVIHIDPWKKHPEFEAGVDWTVDMINFCCDQNALVSFEVATEESIRAFNAKEISTLLQKLKNKLTPDRFKRIKYCVIQSGTSLRENHNTGQYDSEKLIRMIDAVKQYDILTKEHNGDYLPRDLIKHKFELGLDCINIAPEFGQIETSVYLETILSDYPSLFEKYWEICYRSGKWKKWVSSEFDPVLRKNELINICGHYILSNDSFVNNIKREMVDIDYVIKEKINRKIEELLDGIET